jgi:hypothetical protein
MAREVGDGLLQVILEHCRTLRALASSCSILPGVPLRFTPGFMLAPAPRFRKELIWTDRSFSYALTRRTKKSLRWLS